MAVCWGWGVLVETMQQDLKHSVVIYHHCLTSALATLFLHVKQSTKHGNMLSWWFGNYSFEGTHW